MTTTNIGRDGIRLPERDLSTLTPDNEDNGRLFFHDGSGSISLVGGKTTSTAGGYIWRQTDGAWMSVSQSSSVGGADIVIYESAGTVFADWDGRVVSEGTDSSTVIQDACNQLTAVGGGSVLLQSGYFQITSTVEITDGIRLSTTHRAYVENNQTDNFSPTLHFRPGSGSDFLEVNGNGGTGVLVGDAGGPSNIDLGFMNVYSNGDLYDGGTGKWTYGVKFQGYNINFNHIHIFQGNRGLEFNGAADVWGHSAIVVNATTGVDISGGEHIFLDNIDVDSCKYIGVQINGSNEINIEASIWNNADQYTTAALTYGVACGMYGACSHVDIDTKHIGHGGTGLYVDSVTESSFSTAVSNGGLMTSTQTINTGIETTGNTGADTFVGGSVGSVATPLVRGGGSLDIAGVTTDSGTASFNGDGTTTTFSTTHNLGYVPSSASEILVTATPISTDAQATPSVAYPVESTVGGGFDSFEVLLTSAPPSGTGNVGFTYRVDVL